MRKPSTNWFLPAKVKDRKFGGGIVQVVLEHLGDVDAGMAVPLVPIGNWVKQGTWTFCPRSIQLLLITGWLRRPRVARWEIARQAYSARRVRGVRTNDRAAVSTGTEFCESAGSLRKK